MRLSTEIELNEAGCEEYTFTVYAEKVMGQWLFRAVENCEHGREFYYELTEDLHTLKTNSIMRHEILSYGLCEFDDTEKVTLYDIFLHGKYIKRYK